MNSIADIIPILSTPKKIFITTHHKPDGDAIGSSLGLYHFLVQLGHQPVVVAPSDVPDFLQWMPGIGQVLNYEAEPKASLQQLASADLIFCLDFSRLDRVKSLEPHLRNAAQPKVLIDHHLNPELEVFQYGICNSDKSSTCEMVYDFIRFWHRSDLLNTDIMQCLYTGLVTDTGSFRYPATTASVHEMVADFKGKGFNHTVVHENVFDNDKESRLRLLGFALSERMELFPEHKLAIIHLSRQDLEKFHTGTGDTEGIVNFPLTIAGISISVLLTERKDEIKLSFRSRGNVDVSTFAQKNFNGGGHFNAAGGSSKENMETTLQRLKDLIFNKKI